MAERGSQVVAEMVRSRVLVSNHVQALEDQGN
jgi:hypothetical protein